MNTPIIKSMTTPMTVLYDKRCSLCSQVHEWLEEQPKFVQLKFVVADSNLAHYRFPELDHSRTLTELTVISDNGLVYIGEKAWVMCLWALCEYRELAVTLCSPELFPLARRMILWVSNNRHKLNGFLNFSGN